MVRSEYSSGRGQRVDYSTTLDSSSRIQCPLLSSALYSHVHTRTHVRAHTHTTIKSKNEIFEKETIIK